MNFEESLIHISCTRYCYHYRLRNLFVFLITKYGNFGICLVKLSIWLVSSFIISTPRKLTGAVIKCLRLTE